MDGLFNHWSKNKRRLLLVAIFLLQAVQYSLDEQTQGLCVPSRFRREYACELLSEREADLVMLFKELQDVLAVPICGVISDGRHSIRNAVATALPTVPHQLCQFHYLREAAKPVYEADRQDTERAEKAGARHSSDRARSRATGG
jgi:hypothetical protein